MGGSSGNDGGTEPACSLPPDSGPCDAAIPRFYYDPNVGDCIEFSYGGCQGNANNFATVEACRQACVGTADICTLPVVPGPCRGAFPRWFFNSSTGQCEEFVYGGCEGNANNFETEGACANACESPSTCGCIDETISWGNVGGLVAYVDRSEVVPCATYNHRRDPTFTDPISIECSQELMACPSGRLGLSDLLATLAHADVAAARAAAPVLYGRDLRPVDGTVFQIVIGADVIEVGADCTGAPGCVAIPDGVTALVELLRALDAQELGMGECGQAFGG